MGSARAVLLQRLKKKDRHNRFRCFWPATAGGKPIYVHAKILVVDDTLLRVGSSNLNNRSMRFNTECDVAIEATSMTEREQIRKVRDSFIAEHLGAPEEEVSAALTLGASMIEGIEKLSRASGRRLIPFQAGKISEADIEIAESSSTRRLPNRCLLLLGANDGPSPPSLKSCSAFEDKISRRRR